MPVVIPNNLPAQAVLKNENIFTMSNLRASTQDIRPLKILVVNLMPNKIDTETQLARVLSNSPLQVDLTLLRMSTHEASNVSKNHLDVFYTTLDEVKNQKYDGMIVTGAPVENIPFEEVDYWEELCEIFEWSKNNVYSTIHICWGAQAGLYYHHGVPKEILEKKVFGVFENQVKKIYNPLVRGFDEFFYVPVSRNTTNLKSNIIKKKSLRILAESEEAGVLLVSTDNGKEIYMTGHIEYDEDSLNNEYVRDIKKGLDIKVPINYYLKDDPKNKIIFRWRAHANLLFANWLNYYVYQNTPYTFTDK